MTKLNTIAGALFLAAASSAQAHQGLHEGGLFQTLVHMLTEPDHLAIIAAAGSLGYLLFRRVRKKG